MANRTKLKENFCILIYKLTKSFRRNTCNLDSSESMCSVWKTSNGDNISNFERVVRPAC